jgi:hypothetical protein
MRKLLLTGILAAIAVPAAGQEAFDACQVFTQADAEKVLGTAAAGETFNPKVKRPKVVPVCAYNGFKDGKPVEARAQFRFHRTDADAQREFDSARLQYQTKPLMLSGSDASFWSAKTGQMNVRKGRTWITVSVGPPKVSEREMDPAKNLAEALVRKL